MFQRKLFHILSLIPVLISFFLNDFERKVFFLILFVIVFSIDTLRMHNRTFRKLFLLFFKSILKKHESKTYSGATYMFLSFMIVNLLFEREIALFSMLILSISDPIASIFGYYLKPKIRLVRSKTLWGTAGFLISGFLISLIYPYMSISSKFLAILLAGLVELVLPLDDNLTVPLSISVFLEVKGGVQV